MCDQCGTTIKELMFRGFKHVDTINNNMPLPQRGTKQSAGYDLQAATTVVIGPGETKLVPTGVTAFMQSDEWLGIYIRSGVALKTPLRLANGVGVVDADYYPREVNVALWNTGSEPYVIGYGDRIAQGIFHAYWQADNDQPKDQERQGGFGSTGK